MSINQLQQTDLATTKPSKTSHDTNLPTFIKVGKIIVMVNFDDTVDTVNDCYDKYIKIS